MADQAIGAEAGDPGPPLLGGRAWRMHGGCSGATAFTSQSKTNSRGKSPAPGLAGDCRPSPANGGHPSHRPTSRPHRRRAGAGAADESPHATTGRHTHRRHLRREPAQGAVLRNTAPFHDAHYTSPANGVHAAEGGDMIDEGAVAAGAQGAGASGSTARGGRVSTPQWRTQPGDPET